MGRKEKGVEEERIGEKLEVNRGREGRVDWSDKTFMCSPILFVS